jgi:uncharacterized radical SAM protein YgiQ
MPESFKITDWIPVTVKETNAKGFETLDVVIVSGDAYVDHPSFGTAIIARILEKLGLKVAIIPQPNWQDDLRDFRKFGKPDLFFAVTSGNMDSMINHYTANKRKRSDDAYTAGGKAGNRPDYAVHVYTRILKELYPGTPVVIGGIEASLRRLTHYDYWSDALKPSVLASSGADMLIYGMAESAVSDLVKRLKSNNNIQLITDLPQTAFISNTIPVISQFQDVKVYSHEEQLADRKKFALSFRIIEEESNKTDQKRIIEPFEDKFIVVNPPYPLISEQQLDEIYDLPFTRLPHPKYNNKGVIPAYEMIRHSINIHRGCFGGCSFCTISAHQGKFVSSRSESSVLKEVEQVTRMHDFKGHVTDLGGPSANMYHLKGKNPEICRSCKKPSCIYPSVCSNLDTDHSALLSLYTKAAKVKGVKKISIGSGIRYDLLQNPKSPLVKGSANYNYIKKVILEHTSGRLKVAPEHSSSEVLRIMRKPPFRQYLDFRQVFGEINQDAGLKQQLVPYLISSHPGSTIEDMARLAIELKKTGYKPEQVQDFTPTPMTLASVIYYSGIDPYTLKKVYSARTNNEKLDQQKFLLWYKPENREWIRQILLKKHRTDLYNELYDIKPGNVKFVKQNHKKSEKHQRKRHQ